MGCAASFPKMLGPVAMSMEKVEHQKIHRKTMILALRINTSLESIYLKAWIPIFNDVIQWIFQVPVKGGR